MPTVDATSTATPTPTPKKTVKAKVARKQTTAGQKRKLPVGGASGEFGIEGKAASAPASTPAAVAAHVRRGRQRPSAAEAQRQQRGRPAGPHRRGRVRGSGLRSCRMLRDPELTAYLTRFAGQDEVLAQVERETSELPNAGMQSRPDQAALLTMLARMLGARAAVEVGTFTGYGAICIARGLAEGGKLTCLRGLAEYAEIARAQRRRAGWATARRSRSARRRRRSSASPRVRTSTSPTSTPTSPAIRPTTTRSCRGCAPAACSCSTTRCSASRVLDPQDERTARWPRSTSGSPPTSASSRCCSGCRDGMTLARRRA